MKDGMLYNVHVQGPAICSNWCGTEHSRSVVAGDKLFVAIVADSWVNCGSKVSYGGPLGPNATYDQHLHLPQAMKNVYKANAAHTSNSPTASSGDLATAAKLRASILTSMAKNPRTGAAPGNAVGDAAFYSMNNSARELLYTKLYGLEEMRAVGASDTDFTGDEVNPHLLCNFRLKYLTSAEMVETSKLQLNDHGGVLMTGGKWPTGSRCGLAFSRTQIRVDQAFDPELDIWLDPDASQAACTIAGGNAALMPAACAAHDKHGPAAVRKLVRAHADANGDPILERAAFDAFGDDVGSAALVSPHIYDSFRGPPEGAAVHEVIVGAWHIGTVLDTAASRGSGRGFATHNYDSAVNVNVSIDWWSGDRLHKNFANKPGTGQDFSMRSMPSLGWTTNSNKGAAAGVSVMPGVGPGGGKVAVPTTLGSATKGYFIDSHSPAVTQQQLAAVPGGVGVALADLASANTYDTHTQGGGVLTLAETNEEAKAVMDARTSFPDPWDLPASVPMLPISNKKNPTARSDFVGVGRQRGVFAAPAAMTRVGRLAADAEFVNNDSASAPSVERGYVRGRGRVVVSDPGNKLAVFGAIPEMEGTLYEQAGAGIALDQGNIVTI
jgi:hypothetical protein